jgi:hypothetical protein
VTDLLDDVTDVDAPDSIPASPGPVELNASTAPSRTALAGSSGDGEAGGAADLDDVAECVIVNLQISPAGDGGKVATLIRPVPGMEREFRRAVSAAASPSVRACREQYEQAVADLPSRKKWVHRDGVLSGFRASRTALEADRVSLSAEVREAARNGDLAPAARDKLEAVSVEIGRIDRAIGMVQPDADAAREQYEQDRRRLAVEMWHVAAAELAEGRARCKAAMLSPAVVEALKARVVAGQVTRDLHDYFRRQAGPAFVEAPAALTDRGYATPAELSPAA